MSTLLDDVNELLNQNKGDYGRLQHIKETLEKNKQLYVSDRQYVTNLMKKFEDENSPKTYSSTIKYSEKTDDELYSDNENMKGDEEPNTSQTTPIPPSTSSNMNSFCGKCGNPISINNEFCGKCGNPKNPKYDDDLHEKRQTNITKDDVGTIMTRHEKSNAYKTLTLIGGIFGITVTPLLLFSLGFMFAIGSAFSADMSFEEQDASLMWMGIFSSIIISIIAIVVAYVIKHTKVSGIILIILGIAMMISTVFVAGIISYVLFIVAGIIAITRK